MKKEIAKALKDLEVVWDDPAASGDGGARLPEFDGAAKITAIDFELSKNNNPMIVTTFTVVEPDTYEGKEIKRFDNLTKQHFPFLKAFCVQIGLELPNFDAKSIADDIEEAIKEFTDNVDSVFQISVTHDGKYNRIGITSDAEDKDDDNDNGDDDETERREELAKIIKKHKLGIEFDDSDSVEDVEKEIAKAAKKKKLTIKL